MASVRTSADAGNAKKISVVAHYAGTHTVTSVGGSRRMALEVGIFSENL